MSTTLCAIWPWAWVTQARKNNEIQVFSVLCTAILLVPNVLAQGREAGLPAKRPSGAAG